jgi:low affinity Fe/Cu permease
MTKKSWYEQFSKIAAKISGRSGTFTVACAVVGLWLLSGPIFDYSDTWQLAINTATTIITFLMVFLIQHTQNRDAEAVQIKLGTPEKANLRIDPNSANNLRVGGSHARLYSDR